MVPMPGPDEELWPSEILVSDAIGQLIDFWGFKRNMGRVWAVLYLSGEPLNAGDLQARLKISAGAVSMTVNALARWGVVKKVWVQGDRRDHYVAEGNLWKMISRVLAERERAVIVDAIDAMEDALVHLSTRLASEDAEVRERARRQHERIRQLLELARLGRDLLDALVSKGRVDASPLIRILLGARGGPP